MPLIHDQIAFHNVEELEAVPGISGLRLQRFPKGLRESLGFKSHKRGRFFSHRATGCELRFVTEGKFFRLTLSAQEADAEVIVYRGDRAHSQHHLKAGVMTSLNLEEPPFFSQVDPAMLTTRRFAPQLWRITFNQDAIVFYHHLDCFGHAVRPPLPEEIPSTTWLAYGSSITFGANAFLAPNAYVQRAALLLGVDVLNKGLPGSCMCEPQIADYLVSVNWNFVTLELGVNMTDWATTEEFEQRSTALIKRVHEAHPTRSLFVLDIYPNRGDYLLDRLNIGALHTAPFRKIISRFMDQVENPFLHHIPAESILNDLTGLNVDLLHPSDEGHLLMGGNLAAAMKPFLSET